MQVFHIAVPDKPLSYFELERYARQLEIPNFRGVGGGGEREGDPGAPGAGGSEQLHERYAISRASIYCRVWHCEFQHTHQAGKSLGVLLPKQGPENIF